MTLAIDVLRDPLLMPIWVPIVAGLVVWTLPRMAAPLARVIAVVTTLAVAVWSGFIWAKPAEVGIATFKMPALPNVLHWAGRPLFSVDELSGFAAAAAGVLAFIMTVYAVGFSREDEHPARRLYSGILLSVGATMGSLYAENLLVLAVFWGFLGIPFFLLLSMGKDENAPAAAKKAFIIVGGTDSVLILGIAIFWTMTGGSLAIHGLKGPVSTGTVLGAVAYVCMLSAALAKAGAIPLHSWIPDCAASGPVPAVALLPASLDKILGIYLLARISLTLFTLSGYMSTLVMTIGAVTIIAAVFMALIQHNLRKLLGFHAVSQVGYMVLGIGTGTFIGIVGGLFHMLNHAIYKSCLFLTAGSAERKAGTGELAEMGGLARALPVTFVCACVAALSISGVPPLNGFVSKWKIYQGLVELGQGERGGWVWILLLIAAVFGSALTLASFVKVIYGVFLGPAPAGGPKPSGGGESLLMALPMVVLAFACVAFGINAQGWPLDHAIEPSVLSAGVAYSPDAGLWEPGLATILLLIGIATGLVIYLVGATMKVREDSSYTGGEEKKDLRFAGPDFYETVSRISPLAEMYPRAGKGLYDFYEWGYASLRYVGKVLQGLHSGVLYRYVTWTVLGMVILLWALMR